MLRELLKDVMDLFASGGFTIAHHLLFLKQSAFLIQRIA